jgi:capsular exopolysaccharide synthesis family protein
VSVVQEPLHFADYLRVLRSRKEVVVAVFLLVVATGVWVSLTLPKAYEGVTVIEVKDDTLDVQVFAPRDAGTRYDPYFLRTQFEIIQSTPIVEETVRKLGLQDRMAKEPDCQQYTPDKVWGMTVRMLQRGLTVQQFRDTNLIEIRVRLSAPKDNAWQIAADASDAIADIYRTFSMRRRMETTERGLHALQQSLEEQKRRVAAAETKVEEIRQKYNIALLSRDGGTDTALSKLELAQLEANRIRQRVEMEDKRARFDAIMNLTTDEVVHAAAQIVGNSELSVIDSEKRKAAIELGNKLNSGLGVKHPDVIRARAALDELDVKLQQAVVGLKKGVQSDYEASRAKFEALEAEVQRVKQTEIKAEGAGYREYEKAKEELQQAKRIQESLETRWVQERIVLQIPRTTVEVITPAKAADPSEPASPNMPLNVVLSIIIGLAAGIGIAYFVEYMDTSIKSVEETERLLELPVLGVIPQKMKPLNDKRADQSHAEAYRVLRANLRFSTRLAGGKVLAFTSGGVGEGKSLTLYNLAHTSALLGEKVLVIDGDLHRPRQHRLAGLSSKRGLVNVLMGELSVDETIVETGIPNLQMLPSGRVASGAVHGLLDTTRFRKVMDTVKPRYDLILLDAPPVMGVSDTSVLVREVDGVMLVVQHRRYPRNMVRRAREVAETLGANLVGVVLNNINTMRGNEQYYYQYQYYSKDKSAEAEA